MADEQSAKVFPYAAGCEWAGMADGVRGHLERVAAERRLASKEKRPVRWLNVNKGHYEQLDRFLDHLEGHGENPCSVETAVPVTRVAMKLLESARLGLPVTINPEDWNLPREG